MKAQMKPQLGRALRHIMLLQEAKDAVKWMLQRLKALQGVYSIWFLENANNLLLVSHTEAPRKL